VSPADAGRPEPLGDRNVEFDQFYRAEVSRLVRFLALRGAQPADAADAAHQAFVEVFLRWDRVRRMGHPAGYLRRIAANHWMRLQGRPVQDVERAVAGRWIELTMVEDVYGRHEVKEVLASLAALPDRQRQVMAWLYDGYSEEEIAEHLGMKVNTVRSTVRHGRAKLRALGIGEGRAEQWTRQG
jgi:RNA polymerase sigma-70 factor (ECF subfamily)